MRFRKRFPILASGIALATATAFAVPGFSLAGDKGPEAIGKENLPAGSRGPGSCIPTGKGEKRHGKPADTPKRAEGARTTFGQGKNQPPGKGDQPCPTRAMGEKTVFGEDEGQPSHKKGN